MARHFGSPHSAAGTYRRRRIAVICSYTVSLVNFRFRLLKAMVDNGHEVIALGPEHDQPTIDTLASIGVRFVQIPMARAGLNPLQDLGTLRAMTARLREIAPDVVLAYTMKPIVYGLIAARLAGVRERHALVTGLGYVYSDEGADARRLTVRRIATMLYRIALRGDGRVFVYNDADDQDIRKGRMVSDLSRIVPVAGSGVDFAHYPASPVPEGPPVFLMIARLLREKGALDLVEAARRLKARGIEARVQILGPLDPSPLAISKAEVDAWNAEGAVEYLGETKDVRPYLKACSVYVLPSYYREGIPRSILEAMATGRAVVTADTPGCRDTVVEGENGYVVPPRDPAALAAALARFAEDPGLAARMGRRSLDFARERFDVEAVNRKLLGEMGLLAPGRT